MKRVSDGAWRFFLLYTRVGHYVFDNLFEGVVVVAAYCYILKAEKSSGEHQGRSPSVLYLVSVGDWLHRM